MDEDRIPPRHRGGARKEPTVVTCPATTTIAIVATETAVTVTSAVIAVAMTTTSVVLTGVAVTVPIAAT